MTKKMREDFEAWYFGGEMDKATKRTPHGYKYIAAQTAWLAWNAATRAERQRCALLCDAKVYAVDHGGHDYRREATALQCAAAIRQSGV